MLVRGSCFCRLRALVITEAETALAKLRAIYRALSNQMYRWLPIRLAPHSNLAEVAFVSHVPAYCSGQGSLRCGNFR